jgi:phosphoribosylaminoimidazole-succinocarboxamide synthase
MTQTSKPDKQQVRNYMAQRQAEHKPPPTPEQIREELGWKLVEAEREAQKPQ